MGFDDNNKEGKDECTPVEIKKGGIVVGDSDSEIEHEVNENSKVGRQMSESSMYTTEDDDEDENTNKIELGPQCTLKEQFEKDKECKVRPHKIDPCGPVLPRSPHIALRVYRKQALYSSKGRVKVCVHPTFLRPHVWKYTGWVLNGTLKEQFEKDKDDESLRRWKEQLLGSVDINAVGESLDPEVKILSLEIKSPGRADIVLPIPEDGNPKSPWFVLKEGSKYSLKFIFQVRNNIVTGLKYTNTVWKTGIKVDSMKEMIGAFSPQTEPYTHEMPEETTPSGIFARGSYSARTKFLDDDNKCYLEINYTFDIKKEWQAI